jgi:hypothetical protein
MINWVLCISRSMVSMLTPVLSPTGFFWAVIHVLHDCSLCNLFGAEIPHVAGDNCGRLGHCSVSLGTKDGNDCPNTTCI